MTPKLDKETVEICPATLADVARISALHARVFGPGRFSRTAYRLREGAPRVSKFCRKALKAKELVAAVSFTQISIGGTSGALLLGPLAVAPEVANQGVGRELIATGLREAEREGIAVVLLVGDKPYYERFGFDHVPPGQIKLPGPVDPQRLLAWQAKLGVLESFTGMARAE